MQEQHTVEFAVFSTTGTPPTPAPSGTNQACLASTHCQKWRL